MNHRGHAVLGSYCWTCQFRTSNSIPGFDKRTAKNDGVRLHYEPSKVTWADSTRDWPAGTTDRATCVMCKRHDCSHPVHEEKYKTVSNAVATAWDLANPVI